MNSETDYPSLNLPSFGTQNHGCLYISYYVSVIVDCGVNSGKKFSAHLLSIIQVWTIELEREDSLCPGEITTNRFIALMEKGNKGVSLLLVQKISSLHHLWVSVSRLPAQTIWLPPTDSHSTLHWALSLWLMTDLSALRMQMALLALFHTWLCRCPL